MKTIKELAEDYIELQRKDDEYLNVPDVEVMSVEDCEDWWKAIFVEIAEMQRDADIEKAWQWMRKRIKLIGSEMELHSEFVKAMKGEQL